MTGDVAIAHGHYTSQGGAERVATELARTFDAPIYACRVDPDAVPPDVDAHQVFNGRWARFFQSQGRKPETLYWMMKHLYSMIQGTWVPELHEYDTVIISKNEMAWYVPRDGQTIVQYLHSPERAHYDQFYRRGGSVKHRLWSFGYRTAMEQRVIPHRVVCNSETVAERARLAYGIPDDRLDVCYPPVHTDQYSPDLAPEDTGYYLSLGRLYPNKRTGEIVEAFQGRREQLKVAGWGPQKTELEAMAGGHDNIEIIGYVEEHRKRELLAGAKAMVMNAENEDFGIAPIEAFASGTPVIGVDEPYTCHQIIDGENGVLYDRCDLDAGIERFETAGVAWSAERLTGFADRFDADRFRDAMRRHVANARDVADVSPPWKDEPDDQVVVEPVVDEAVTDGGANE